MAKEVREPVLGGLAATSGATDATMSEEDIARRIKELVDELRELRARIPQSDWHMAFEALLRIEAYGLEGIEVRSEVEIGYAPPRADFIVFVNQDDVPLSGDVFASFRHVNVLEYKRPDDSLNLRTVFKALGYAGMLIGTAEHEDDVPVGQVTISLFRSKLSSELMDDLVQLGATVRTVAPGVYDVKGLSVIPLQLVATSELEGDEYAMWRVLTDEAHPEDIELVSKSFEAAAGSIKDLWRKFMALVVEKNVSVFESLEGKDIVSDAIMELVEDRVRERERIAVEAQTVKYTRSLMEALGYTADEAMALLEVPEGDRDNIARIVGGN